MLQQTGQQTRSSSIRYKVLYHAGEVLNLKTRGQVGRLLFEGGCLKIEGKPAVSVSFNALRSVQLFRVRGIARMLRIEHEEGTLFVTVIRLSVFGFFAVVNYFATGRLKQELEALIPAQSTIS